MKSFKISNYDIGMPAILAGAGILTLIICMIVLIPGREAPDENTALDEAVARMETRIAALESRLESTMAAPPPAEPSEIPADALSEYEVHVQSITDQIAGIQKKIDYIDKRQGNLEERVVGFTAPPPKRESSRKQAANSAPKQASSRRQEATSAPKQAASTKQASAPKQAAVPAPKKEIAAKQTTPALKKEPAETKQAPAKSAKYHLVAAGDTRYSIARQYGLTVAQLNAINGFSEQTIIQPGQKIVVQK